MKMNMNMKVKGPGGARLRRLARRRRLRRRPDGRRGGRVRTGERCAGVDDQVTGLEGTRAQVYAEDGSLEGQFTLPFNFKGRGDTYYRFVFRAPTAA